MLLIEIFHQYKKCTPILQRKGFILLTFLEKIIQYSINFASVTLNIANHLGAHVLIKGFLTAPRN